MKHMKILFIRMAGKRFPHRSAEIASPVAGRPAVFPVFYIEKVSIFTVRILAGLLKPFMFVRTVVHHKIHQDIHISFFRLFDQALHVFHSSETGINAVIIRDIVSLIRKGRFINWRKPDDIHAEILQVVQFGDNAGQIPDSVPLES